MTENIMPDGTPKATISGSFSPSRSEKVQSRYLKPYMGSCHDNCKYGKKHDPEAVTLKTFIKKRREQIQATTPNGEDKRQVTLPKPKIKAESKPKNVFSDKSPSLAKKSISPSAKTPTSRVSKGTKGSKRKTWFKPQASEGDASENPDKMKGITVSVSEPISPVGTKVVNLVNSLPASEADDISMDCGSDEDDTESVVNELIASVAPKVINLASSSSASEVDPSENLSSTQDDVASAKIKQKEPSVKKVHTVNKKAPFPLKRRDLAARTPLVKSLSHLKSSRSLIVRRNQEKKMTNNTLKFGGVNSKPVNTLKTVKAPLLRSISTKRNQEKFDRSEGAAATSKKKALIRAMSQIKPSRSLNARGMINSLLTSNIAERKVLKPTPASRSSKAPLGVNSILIPRKLRSVKRSTSSSNNKVGDAENSGNVTLKSNNKYQDSRPASTEGISKIKITRGPKKPSTVRQQDNVIPAPYKLKFRQGKVMDLRCDSGSARRLWFKIGKVSGENQKSNNSLAPKRSFRKKEADVSDTNAANSESRAVVLKHKDTEKKDAQALFNHVIEETASKLVESRKSKVKALVGAFETVISLQES